MLVQYHTSYSPPPRWWTGSGVD